MGDEEIELIWSMEQQQDMEKEIMQLRTRIQQLLYQHKDCEQNYKQVQQKVYQHEQTIKSMAQEAVRLMREKQECLQRESQLRASQSSSDYNSQSPTRSQIGAQTQGNAIYPYGIQAQVQTSQIQQSQINSLRQHYENEIQKLNDLYQREIANIKQNQDQALKTQINELSICIKNLNVREYENNERCSQLQIQNSKIKQEIEKQIGNQIDMLQAENQKQKQLLQKKEQEINNLNNEIESLQYMMQEDPVNLLHNALNSWWQKTEKQKGHNDLKGQDKINFERSQWETMLKNLALFMGDISCTRANCQFLYQFQAINKDGSRKYQ